MKKILVALVALTVSFGAIAQGESKRENRLGKEKIAELNLTDSQKEQMKAEKDVLKKKLEELRGNTGMSTEDMKKNRLEIMKTHKEAVKSILSPEQQEKVKEMRKERNAEGSKVSGEGRGKKMKERVEEIKQELNLSEEQSTKMKTLNEKLKANMKRIRDNSSLSQEQKKEQVKSLMANHKSSVDAILTAEQKTKMDAIRKEKGGHKGKK